QKSPDATGQPVTAGKMPALHVTVTSGGAARAGDGAAGRVAVAISDRPASGRAERLMDMPDSASMRPAAKVKRFMCDMIGRKTGLSLGPEDGGLVDGRRQRKGTKPFHYLTGKRQIPDQKII